MTGRCGPATQPHPSLSPPTSIRAQSVAQDRGRLGLLGGFGLGRKTPLNDPDVRLTHSASHSATLCIWLSGCGLWRLSAPRRCRLAELSAAPVFGLPRVAELSASLRCPDLRVPSVAVFRALAGLAKLSAAPVSGTPPCRRPRHHRWRQRHGGYRQLQGGRGCP